MGKVAFLFPGQGTQYSGMGWELYENSKAAKAVFDCAEALRPGTREQCFTGSAEELSVTENTQPCLFCVDLAAAVALREAGGKADMLAGFSLGELAALTFSGAVSMEDAFRLVNLRASFMQKATKKVDASMVAVLRMEDDEITSLCCEFEHVYPVNFNAPGQVVVSGKKNELEEFKVRVREKNGRILPVKVSGGFHSPFMADAAKEFSGALSKVSFSAPLVPLYSNVTALPYSDDMRGLLTKQICSPVLWRKAVLNMIDAGADTFIEVGPGKVLSGLVSRISENVRIFNVEDIKSLRKTISEVEAGA
ncbi:Malonyl CoA-acyl carrier protein transacylase [bioreactor metagenome]|uniref:[acyl-carrier-protein] S-malonyltransferase n=1 Tax=bioreactor metagenome TaxID=1076179 RepID=A0A644WZZ7_9ZZZZ